MIGVIVSFDYDGDFDRERVAGIARKSTAKFEGMPGLRLKVFVEIAALVDNTRAGAAA